MSETLWEGSRLAVGSFASPSGPAIQVTIDDVYVQLSYEDTLELSSALFGWTIDQMTKRLLARKHESP